MTQTKYKFSFFLTLVVYLLLFMIIFILHSQKVFLSPNTPLKHENDLVKFEIIEYIPPKTVQTTTPQPIQKPLEKITKIPEKIVPKTPPQKKVTQQKPIAQKPIPKVAQKIETPQISPHKELLSAKKEPSVKKQIPVAPKIDHQQVARKKDAYFAQVKQIIDRNKAYPKIAIRRGIEGLVKIQFTLSNNGELLSYVVLDGPKIFQKSIEKAIQESFPLHPPKDLFSSNIDLSLTLHYKLQ